MKVSVGFLVAYDYELLKYALPQVYEQASHIVLACDKDCRSFSGTPFNIDPEFFNWVTDFDKKGKIRWNRGDFYRPELKPLEVETFTRNQLFKELLEPMDWYIQLDCDEYILDFDGFLSFLKQVDRKKINSIKVFWKTLYKQTTNGFFVIGGLPENVTIAATFPNYKLTRHVHDQKIEEAPFVVLHQSWARPEPEVKFKLSNWGHKDDLSAGAFFKSWKNCNSRNYRFYRHFHPLHPPLWPFLEYVPVHSPLALIQWYSENPPVAAATPPLPVWYRLFKKVTKLTGFPGIKMLSFLNAGLLIKIRLFYQVIC